MGRLQHELERLAEWWTQAPQESRFELVQRLTGQKTPEKGDPTLQTLYFAIVLAESSSGEIEIRG